VFSSSVRLTIAPAILGILAIISAAHARDAGSDGGSGGGAFRSTCNPQNVLIGFNLTMGKSIDAIKPICIPLSPDGKSWTGSAYETQKAGGNGGKLFKIACNPGNVVKTIRTGVDRNNMVSGVSIRCVGLADPNGLTTPFVIGNSQGVQTQQQNFECRSGELATGIYGRSGAMLDALGLVCDTFAFAQPKPRPVPTPVKIPETPPVKGPNPPVASIQAKVVQPVDVYDAPDGKGKKISFLRAGTVVKLITKPCPNDWCNVTGSALPRGGAFVYNGPDYRSLQF
jgi:hypothetical protein